jgi:hypothetical protein
MAIKSPDFRKPYIIYGGLALLILLPLLKPGFVLALDMVFTPHLRMPDSVTSSYILHAMLRILNFVLPSDVLEKLLLFTAFFGAGVGMHRLVQYVHGAKGDVYQTAGTYFAGLLYMANPFTYDRLMTGQYNVLLGYALLPFFVRGLLMFVRAPHIRSATKLAAWTILVSIVSIHTLGLAVILGLVAIGLYGWQRRAHRLYLLALLRWSLIGIALFVVASSYWLVPLAFGKGDTAHEISSFTTSDTQAFATVGQGTIGTFGNIIRLQGFWAENRGMYTLPQERIAAWGLLMLVLWVLVGAGAVHGWRSKQRIVVAFAGISMVVATVLALGVGNQWLAAHAPFFAGYREPQKFVALLALGYALFSAWGVAATLRYCQRQT